MCQYKPYIISKRIMRTTKSFLFYFMHLQFKYASLLKVFLVVVDVICLEVVEMWRWLRVELVTVASELRNGFGGTGGGPP